MRLYLVRHAQTSWNIGGRAQGHTDIPLDPTGLGQTEKLKRAFQTTRIDRILSSDLTRCLQTATPVSEATGIPLEIRPDLRERSFGQWEGRHFTEVSAQLAEKAAETDSSPLETRPPGGESYADVWRRLDPVYNILQESDDDIAVVSHGGALSLLLAKLLRGTLDTSRAFRFENTGITLLERRSDGLFLMTRYNDTAHLASEPVLSGSLDARKA